MKAIVLFGHGSRDPLWRLPLESVAARLRDTHPDTPVRCAYLELQAPDLGSATDELVAGGATEVTIVPMFLGTGRHAREDLPLLVDGLKVAHPAVTFRLQQAVGEDARVVELLARIASE